MHVCIFVVQRMWSDCVIEEFDVADMLGNVCTSVSVSARACLHALKCMAGGEWIEHTEM